jgi:hypothetical protein
MFNIWIGKPMELDLLFYIIYKIVERTKNRDFIKWTRQIWTDSKDSSKLRSKLYRSCESKVRMVLVNFKKSGKMEQIGYINGIDRIQMIRPGEIPNVH